MPTTCHFQFKRSTPIYYSGEQITGSIRVTTTMKCLPLEAITLSFIGYSQVEWLENDKCFVHRIEHNDSTDNDDENRIRYSGIEEHHNETLILAENLILEEGSYVDNFHFTVPSSSLPTCRQPFGEIAYLLRVTLQRQSTFNKIFEENVVVKNKLDLNDKEKKLNQNRFVSSNVDECNNGKSQNEIEFHIGSGGYVPGQEIRYHLESENFLETEKICVNLCRSVTYRSLEPKPKCKEVVKILADNRNHETSIAFRHIMEGSLRIPLTAGITVAGDKSLLSITFHMEAVVEAGRFNRTSQKLIIPITIGTVPLRINSILANDDSESFCYDNMGSSEVESLRECPSKALSNFSYWNCLEDLKLCDVTEMKRKHDKQMNVLMSLKQRHENQVNEDEHSF